MTVAKIDSMADAGKMIVAVSGEVDLAINDELVAALQAAIAARKGAILVDLSNTTFIDSRGIAALVDGMRAAKDAGIDYRITGATGIVEHVLEVTGMLTLLSGEPDLNPA